MARIFITGSADGLGQLAAKSLIGLGHRVVLHARNAERARQAMQAAPGAESVLIADLSCLNETKSLAAQANASGRFDAIIHNAGVYQVATGSRGVEGFPTLFTVNTLAPYVLTCAIQKPQRLIYLSSGMHRQGNANLSTLSDNAADTSSHITYSDTKLHDLLLGMAVARMWKDVYVNTVDPGWVPTKMGGAGAPDDLELGFQTQVWLAVSNDSDACVSGQYFHHKRQTPYLRAADDARVQDTFLATCAQLTGVELNNE